MTNNPYNTYGQYQNMPHAAVNPPGSIPSHTNMSYGYNAYGAPAPGQTVYTVERVHSVSLANSVGFALVCTGVILAVLGAFLPFFQNDTTSLNLMSANAGAGFSVLLVTFPFIVLMVLVRPSKKPTVARVLAFLGMLAGPFLVVFSIAHLYGDAAEKVLSNDGWRGIGGPFIVGGGLSLLLGSILIFVYATVRVREEKKEQQGVLLQNQDNRAVHAMEQNALTNVPVVGVESHQTPTNLQS